MRRLLSKVMVTSARPRLRRDVEPLKITSAISPPRRLLALCSPRIQRTASTILLLPLPFGPTMPVMPAVKSNGVLSAKLLKPTNSKRLSMPTPVSGQWPVISGRAAAVAKGPGGGKRGGYKKNGQNIKYQIHPQHPPQKLTLS